MSERFIVAGQECRWVDDAVYRPHWLVGHWVDAWGRDSSRDPDAVIVIFPPQERHSQWLALDLGEGAYPIISIAEGTQEKVLTAVEKYLKENQLEMSESES